MDHQVELLGDLRQLKAGRDRLRLAVTQSIGEHLLPDLLLAFADAYPDYRIDSRVGYSRSIHTRLATGLADLALTEIQPDHPDVLVQKWLDDELVLVCSPRHVLGSCEMLAVAEIPQLNYVLRERESSMRITLDRALADIGIHELPIAMEVGSTDTIVEILERGRHVSFLPRFAVKGAIEDGALHHIRVEGLRIRRTLWIARTRANLDNPVAEAFIKLIRELVPGRADASEPEQLLADQPGIDQQQYAAQIQHRGQGLAVVVRRGSGMTFSVWHGGSSPPGLNERQQLPCHAKSARLGDFLHKRRATRPHRAPSRCAAATGSRMLLCNYRGFMNTLEPRRQLYRSRRRLGRRSTGAFWKPRSRNQCAVRVDSTNRPLDAHGRGPRLDMLQQGVATSGAAVVGVHGDTGQFGQAFVREGVQCRTGDHRTVTLDHRELVDLLFEQFARALDQRPRGAPSARSVRGCRRRRRSARYGSARRARR